MIRAGHIMAIVAGLALAAYAACSPNSARADDTRGLVPAGTVIERRPDVGQVTRTVLPAPRFLLDRGQVNAANACAAAKAQLEALLADALSAGERLARPEPTWRIAGRWALVGAAVGAAFVGGAWIF